MTVTHEHAVEVDTKLADLWGREQKADFTITQAIQSLHSSLGHKVDWHSRRGREYTESADATEAEARNIIATPHGGQGRFWVRPFKLGVYGKYLQRALAEIDAARVDYAAARAEAEPLEEEFRAERWSRFFLVIAAGGHIHKDRQCSTTHPTTLWSWLPSLSGLGEDAAVEQQGPRLCSVCFPSAPVEWTLGLPAKVDPKRCPGSGEKATDQDRRHYTPRGRCAVCGTSVAISSTGKARAHHKPA